MARTAEPCDLEELISFLDSPRRDVKLKCIEAILQFGQNSDERTVKQIVAKVIRLLGAEDVLEKRALQLLLMYSGSSGAAMVENPSVIPTLMEAEKPLALMILSNLTRQSIAVTAFLGDSENRQCLWINKLVQLLFFSDRTPSSHASLFAGHVLVNLSATDEGRAALLKTLGDSFAADVCAHMEKELEANGISRKLLVILKLLANASQTIDSSPVLSAVEKALQCVTHHKDGEDEFGGARDSASSPPAKHNDGSANSEQKADKHDDKVDKLEVKKLLLQCIAGFTFSAVGRGAAKDAEILQLVKSWRTEETDADLQEELDGLAASLQFFEDGV